MKNVNCFGQKKVYFVELIRNGVRKVLHWNALSLKEAQVTFQRRNKKQLDFIKYRIGRMPEDVGGYNRFVDITESRVNEDRWQEEVLEQKVDRIISLWGWKEPVSKPIQELIPVQIESFSGVQDEFAFL